MTDGIRPTLLAAQERAWRRLAAAGTWWTGRERVAIAAETRAATACTLCRARREAVSAGMVAGTHDRASDLPDAVVEAVHRIRTDSGRLPSRWVEATIAAIGDARYVELVGVLATVTAVDSFRHALGLPAWALPEPVAGAPARRRPPGAKPDRAHVAMVAPADVTAADAAMYAGRSAAYIHRALSLVPAEVVGFFDLDDEMYLPDALLRDYGREYRAVSHAQIELLAARVSALNQCTY